MTSTIGKARHPSRTTLSYDREAGPPRGLLHVVPPEGRFHHARHSPPPDLQCWIEHYWMVRWDLRGCERFRAETLPHPNIQLTFETGRASINGIPTAKFERWLEDAGSVVGIKFKAGCFRPFLGRSVSQLRGREIAASAVLGIEVDEIARRIDQIPADQVKQRFEEVSDFLRRRLPEPDSKSATANGCVNLISNEPSIRSVDDLSRSASLAKRSLQRLFGEYVGAPAKWVIQRYRLFELLDSVRTRGTEPDWATLAVELGYFDQAHLINDFRSATGVSPSRFLAANRSPG